MLGVTIPDVNGPSLAPIPDGNGTNGNGALGTGFVEPGAVRGLRFGSRYSGCPGGGMHRSGRRRAMQFLHGNRRLEVHRCHQRGTSPVQRTRPTRIVVSAYTARVKDSSATIPDIQPQGPVLTHRKHSTQEYCSRGFFAAFFLSLSLFALSSVPFSGFLSSAASASSPSVFPL